MAILARDVAVAMDEQRPRFDGRRQRAALVRLQQKAGRNATTVASEVGLSYPQYNRYLWGRTPLRSDQFAAFARAYGVSVAELAEALGFGEPPPDPEGWTQEQARAYLEAEGLPPEHVESRMDVLADLKPLSRRGAAEAFVLIWRRHLADSAPESLDALHACAT